MNLSEKEIHKFPEASRIEINADYGCEYSEKYYVLVLQKKEKTEIRVEYGDDTDLLEISYRDFEDLWCLMFRKKNSPDIDLFEPDMGLLRIMVAS